MFRHELYVFVWNVRIIQCIYMHSFIHALGQNALSKPLDRSLWGSLDHYGILLPNAFDWVQVPTTFYLSLAVIGG